MKYKKQKSYLIIGILLLGISILFYGCQKDAVEAEDQESQIANSIFSKINFNTFKHKVIDKDLNNIDINHLIPNQTVSISQSQYTTESQDYVIAIDSTDVLMAEKDGTTTFTFKTQTQDMSKTTNYVLAYDTNNIEEFYLTYDENGKGDIINPTTGYEIVTEGVTMCAFSQFVMLCRCQNHMPDRCNGCDLGFYSATQIISAPCDTNSDLNGAGGGGPGGPTGDLPIDGIITKELKDEPNTEDDECETLNNLMANPPPNTTNPYTQNTHPDNADGKNKNIRLAITNIDNSFTPNTETGFGFYNRGNYPTFGPYAQHVPASAHNQVDFPGKPWQFGTIHTHPTGSQYYQMFSENDIYMLLNIRDVYTADAFLNSNNTYGDKLFVTALVVKQAGETHTYAIKIDDYFTFKETMEQKKANDIVWKDFAAKLKTKLKNDAKDLDGTATQYQKAFLEFIQSQNLGISLYEMEQTNAGTQFVQESWKKLSLDSNNTVVETPCNNN
ncbi:hypothetical protein [Winogradskyella sp.]|uniref:hypothetical protein n=1 Tax=Winogradskyella sp. TaxID=1883156 RepID=UPI0025F23012|nr:hypothetical protein [Winogradskyella sp.]